MTHVDAARWRVVRQWFDELADLDPISQETRLGVLGSSDPNLRDEVASLLRADAEVDDRLGGFERLLRPYRAPSPERSSPSTDPLGLSGRMISHFRVIEPIAVGGMGVVYRAEDTRLARTVALKLPLPERFGPDGRQRFLRESRAAGALDHPNVCTIYEVGESDDGYLYLAMPLYAGETLAARLARTGRLDVTEAIAITRAIVRGVGAAHAAGIVHRDIKAANVMLLPDGGLRVLDFGLAKSHDASLTHSGTMMGTVSYMAPEQIRDAPADVRADLWAIGVVLYEMLTGQRPFAAEREIAIAYAILHDEPRAASALRPEIPPVLDSLVRSLLDKDPARRPSSASEIEAALDAPPAKRKVFRSRNLAIGWWAAAGIAVIAVAIAAFVFRPHSREIEYAVVADVETDAAGSETAGIMTNVMQRVLAESRTLRAVPEYRVRAVRQRLQIEAGTRLTTDLARQVALGAGVRSVVVATLTPFGGNYAIQLRLLSASSNEGLASVERSNVPVGAVFAVLDTLTQRLREQAGDDVAAIRAQPPIPALTSTSLEAMTEYVSAMRLRLDSVPQAVSLLRDAIRRDSSFAAALWQLSRLLERTQPRSDSEVRALLARAWNHRSGLTDYEQLRLEDAYKFTPSGVTPDVTEHFAMMRRIVDRYPNALDAKTLGDLYVAKRELDSAERTYRQMIALDPTNPEAYSNLTTTIFRQGRLRDAKRELAEFRGRFPDNQNSAPAILIPFGEGSLERTRAVLQRMVNATGTIRSLGMAQLPNLDLLEGKVSAWRRDIDAVESSGERLRGSIAGTLSYRLNAAYWVRKRPDEGLRILEGAIARDSSLRLTADAAAFYAMFGRPDSARALLAARRKTNRSAYMRGTDTLPVVAWIDLAERRSRDAAANFRASLRLIGGTALSQIGRDAEAGLAFELGDLPDSAIVVYEHYLQAPRNLEIDTFKQVWVLEHAAALYEKRNDRRKARAAYAQVVDLWKGADPELQDRVKTARDKVAALR